MSSTLSRSIRQLQRCQSSLSRGGRQIVLVKPFSTALGGGSVDSSKRFGENKILAVGQHNLIKIQNGTAAFSTNAEAATAATTTTTTEVEIEIASPGAEKERKPSVLTQLATDYTPGHAWSLLQQHFRGGLLIRHDDFKALCLSARPRFPKDAKVIRTALLDLRRCNRFVCNISDAQIAMEGMIRSLRSDEKNGETTSPEHKIKAGIFAGEAFVDTNTGLYVAAETDVVNDTVLESLWSGVDEFEYDEDGKDGDDSDDMNPIEAAAKVARDTVRVLFKRASNPTRDMKKKAKRRYLKMRKTTGGPSPLSIDYAVKVCLKAGENGLGMARKILDEYERKEFLGVAMEETVTLVKDAEAKLAAEKEAEAAAAAEESEGDEESEDEAEK